MHDNISISYNEQGEPDGLPIVFIHGFPFSSRMWNPQLSVLPSKIRALTYDVRGHGLSGVGDGQYTIDQYVDDLIALLDHLNIKETIICGLSMGGYIALRSIEKHPKYFCGLILCDTKSEADTDEAKIKRAAAIRLIKNKGVETFADDFLKSIFWDRTFENNPDIIQYIRNIILMNSPIGICGVLLALAARTDTSHILAAIKIPTCIVVGEHDKLTPPSAAKSMSQSIANSELHILSNCGHMSNLENSRDFNDRLIAFLKKNWLSG